MTMTPLRSMPALLVFLACALAAGCAHKKTVLVMPQQPPPSTAPTPVPAARKKPPVSPSPQPSPTPEQGQSQHQQATRNGTRTKGHTATRKPSPQVSAAHNRRVIDNGATPPPVVASPSPEQLSQQAETDQLVKNTENAIKGIRRQLTQNEKAMLAQIRDFIQQSRFATQNKDFARAHNLAWKAHLLSNELAKTK